MPWSIGDPTGNDYLIAFLPWQLAPMKSRSQRKGFHVRSSPNHLSHVSKVPNVFINRAPPSTPNRKSMTTYLIYIVLGITLTTLKGDF